MAPFPKWHSDAIDVTNGSDARLKVPVHGKPWYGGSGKRKLILHTIEGDADPWTIGWPRYWPNVRAAPHFYLNSDRWPDKDWLYQTLPMDVAGYALRSNATEDDKYVWQVEIAGQAAKTPGYPDSFYQAIAELCDWFVERCGVDDVVFNIQTGGRMTQAELDRFSGICGHRNAGAGVDTHTDPGRYFDQARLRRFMGTTPEPPDPPPSEEEPLMYSMYHGDGFTDGDRPGKKSDVINFQLKLRDLGHSLTTDGKYGDQTAAALKAFLGSGAVNDGRTFTGRNGYEVDRAFAALQAGGGDGYDHTGLEKKVAEGAVRLTAHKASTDHDNRYVQEVTVKGPTP
jgi:hypothetical protein